MEALQTSLRMSQSDGLYSWVLDMINMNDGRLYDGLKQDAQSP